jgi:glycosyltransferase involved in cell wall biosynthesis
VFGLPPELNVYRFNRKFSHQLRAKATNRSYSFVYHRLSVGNISGITLSRELRVPLILEYNGSEAWVSRNWGTPLRHHDVAVAAEEACLRHAHLIVTVSDALREELISRGIEADRIVTYPNCIDPNVFNPERFAPSHLSALREKLDLSPDDLVVSFIGTFGQWHGVDVFARTIRTLVDTASDWLTQRRVRFLLIGDGMRMGQVRKILEGAACEPFYALTGLVPQREAPTYLAASDILVSPHTSNEDGSRFFGSPTKLFEYMAMGKGIVASDLDQIGAVLARGIRVDQLPAQTPSADEDRIAVLTAPGDVSALEKGIRFLVENPAWRNTLGRNARREALNNYTWDRHVDAIVSALSRTGLIAPRTA